MIEARVEPPVRLAIMRMRRMENEQKIDRLIDDMIAIGQLTEGDRRGDPSQDAQVE